MKSLDKSGLGGGAKVFSAKDLEGLTPEQMEAKFSGKKPSRKPKTPKATTPKMKIEEDDGEHIEL